MFKSGFKALLLSGLIFISNSFYFVNANGRAIDYSMIINKDFTDGLHIKNSHMCGNCRDANDLTIIIDSGVPIHHKTIIDNMIKNKIPSKLVDSFRYSGNRLVLTSKDIREYEGAGLAFEPSGAYSSVSKTLYLSNKYNNYWAEQSLVHEFGHYLDFTVCHATDAKNRVSNSSEFRDIWKLERGNFKIDYLPNLSYYQNSPNEYFAQAFDEYILNPTRLKQNTPKTYAYIERCLKIIELSV